MLGIRPFKNLYHLSQRFSSGTVEEENQGGTG